MDYSKKLSRIHMFSLAVVMIVLSILGAMLWTYTSHAFASDFTMQLIVFGGGVLIVAVALSFFFTKVFHAPLKKIADVIVFVGHSSRGGTAPNTDKLLVGKEMITSLAQQVYDIASMNDQLQQLRTEQISTLSSVITSTNTSVSQTTTQNPMQAVTPTVLDHVGLPIIGIDATQTITAANRAASAYLGKESAQLIGAKLYDCMSLAFDTEETFDAWLKNIQQSAVTGIRLWERARIVDQTGKALRQFDMVASYSKDNQSGTDTMIAIYDRTEQYAQDSEEIGFVALAVHELRTPLTVMRGYIEVFEDELGPSLNDEMKSFMHKMQASAQQLTAFVGNILNVARVEENQLVLKLQQHSWKEIVTAAVSDLDLRARVNKKVIELQIADNIPPVAVDRISIHEVINNLVDNALKYSGNSEKIRISSVVNSDGLVETSVQDFGVGIPQSVMPDLFQKFYRSHKSKSQIGGTGLGLYLCKAIVNAHGGNIWVRSHEGQGSIFSFTLQPFDSVKHEQPQGEDGIMRGAHGWIKNHTLNRQ